MRRYLNDSEAKTVRAGQERVGTVKNLRVPLKAGNFSTRGATIITFSRSTRSTELVVISTQTQSWHCEAGNWLSLNVYDVTVLQRLCRVVLRELQLWRIHMCNLTKSGHVNPCWRHTKYVLRLRIAHTCLPSSCSACTRYQAHKTNNNDLCGGRLSYYRYYFSQIRRAVNTVLEIRRVFYKYQ